MIGGYIFMVNRLTLLVRKIKSDKVFIQKKTNE